MACDVLYVILGLIAKVIILSSISSGLEFWSENHTYMCENSESNVIKNTKFLGEI